MARTYQDRFARGTVVGTGYRDCAGRYALIAPLVGALGRGRTVLDFGAHDGYFAFRLAHDYQAHVLALDSRKHLTETARQNGDPRVRVHITHATPETVAALSRHDVVLALSVLHHNRHWRALLTALLGRTKRWLLVETPHPDEPLEHAVARDELAAIAETVAALGVKIGEAPAVKSAHRRSLYQIPSPGPLRGAVFTGSGHCSHFWTLALRKRLAGILGYRPMPGSLNLRLTKPLPGPVRLLLGPPHRRYWDRRRAPSGRHGGDYQFWRARFGLGDFAMDAHVMLPGSRVHRQSLELVAPVNLRHTWHLEDGSTLWVRWR